MISDETPIKQTKVADNGLLRSLVGQMKLPISDETPMKVGPTRHGGIGISGGRFSRRAYGFQSALIRVSRG